MGFEDVKIGDVVMIQKIISYGWNCEEYFYLPNTVTSVTKAQFVAGEYRIQKKDGSIVGGKWLRAKRLGARMPFGGIVCDQTKEMEAFSSKIMYEQKLESFIREMRVQRNGKLSADKLKDILQRLKEIDACLT